MSEQAVKVSKNMVSCSDNGEHPLVYIDLKNGNGKCQYCGQAFIRVAEDELKQAKP
ncbi:MAG: zinc-finger domain-containing protein [Mariprofundaceae bacterium]